MSSHEKAKAMAGFNGPFKLPISNVNHGQNRSLNGINGSHDPGSVSENPKNDEKYSVLFEPRHSRAWQKSRKIEDDHQTSSTDAMPTREELDAQLRPEDEGLIPLSAIADRIVHYAWQLFANQVEINPSMPPLQRRQRIYNDAHEARKQLIKLLVLTQWAKSSQELQVARNLISFIGDHVEQSNSAYLALKETKSILESARLRNYDLVTAIGVLSRGRPQSIPPMLKEHLDAQKAYTDTEAIAIVQELDDALRLRLASEELLATPMLSYTISDGRACFVAADLFEADLTLSGSSSEDRWWLLRVKFDFRITGSGADTFPRQLKGVQRRNLIDLADSELAPRSLAAITETQGNITSEEEMNGTGDSAMQQALVETDDNRFQDRKDAPLIRLYNLLQSQSLHYRLDILHWQASQLIKLSWGKRLNVFMDASRELHVQYWKNGRSSNESPNDEWDPIARAEIRFSVIECELKQGSTEVIKSLFEKNDERMQKPLNLRLKADWDVKGIVLDFLPYRDIFVDHHSLDAESILIRVTQNHAKAAMDAFKSRIDSSSLSKTIRTQLRSRSAGRLEEYGLLIFVHERLTVELSIDLMSGQVQLEEISNMDDAERDETLSCSTLARMRRTDYVRDASKTINERPRFIVGILQRLRCQVLIEDLEEKCTLNGLECTTRMPLRQVDYAQLQATPSTLLFIALQQCPTYYLVLHVGEDCFRVALMCVGTFLEDMITSMRIVSLERLDWIRVLQTCRESMQGSSGKRKRDDEEAVHVDPLSMSEDDFAILHSYSVALVSYHKVEEQFRQRGVHYMHIGGLTNRKEGSFWTDRFQKPNKSRLPEDSVTNIVPSICIDAQMFLGNVDSTFVKRNVMLRLLDWNDPNTCRVEFALKVTLRSNLVSRTDVVEGRNKIHYDGKAGLLIFSVSEIDACFDRFLASWRRIEKILGLVRNLWLLKKRQERKVKGEKDDGGLSFFSLRSFDLVNVTFVYAHKLIAKVGWVQDPFSRQGGRYTLAFGAEAGSEIQNPHSVLRLALERYLNQGNEMKATFWYSFLNLLRRTLPIVTLVHRYPEESMGSLDIPELSIKSATWIQLIFLDRFKIDVKLLSANRVLFADAGRHVDPQNFEKSKTELDEFDFHPSLKDRRTGVDEDILLNWSSLPTFEKIVNDLASEISEHGKEGTQDQTTKSSSFALPFTNALLYRGDVTNVEWILKRLIEQATKALQPLTDSIQS